jgi:hypothetical protein
VLHVSQIAELLGLAAPRVGSPERDGAASVVLLDAWLGRVRRAEWEELVKPTPSRGRTLRNLTVNVFHPFELLPEAWASGEFDWRPEEDSTRERMEREELLAWAYAAAAGWRSFLDREDIAARDPVVQSPRGETRFSTLVSFQRWHAAYHYRQLVHVLGVEDGGLLEGLALPREVF